MFTLSFFDRCKYYINRFFVYQHIHFPLLQLSTLRDFTITFFSFYTLLYNYFSQLLIRMWTLLVHGIFEFMSSIVDASCFCSNDVIFVAANRLLTSLSRLVPLPHKEEEWNKFQISTNKCNLKVPIKEMQRKQIILILFRLQVFYAEELF